MRGFCILIIMLLLKKCNHQNICIESLSVTSKNIFMNFEIRIYLMRGFYWVLRYRMFWISLLKLQYRSFFCCQGQFSTKNPSVLQKNSTINSNLQFSDLHEIKPSIIQSNFLSTSDIKQKKNFFFRIVCAIFLPNKNENEKHTRIVFVEFHYYYFTVWVFYE